MWPKLAQAASKTWLWTKRLAVGGAVVGGVGAGGKAVYDHSQHPGVSGGAGNQFDKSVLQPLKDMGITFGTGSLVAGGAAYAIGHFLLDSPMLGLGLAAVGAFAGQPIMDAITKATNTPAAPKTTPANEAAAKKEAPVQEVEKKFDSGLPPTAQGKAAPDQPSHQR